MPLLFQLTDGYFPETIKIYQKKHALKIKVKLVLQFFLIRFTF